MLDTWSTNAEPRTSAGISRWIQAGLCDTFRILHPDLQVATHYSTHGDGASRLDYILSTAPHHLTPVGAAIHVGAVWPFDHHPVLADFWGASAPVPSTVKEFGIKWERFQEELQRAEGTKSAMDVLRDRATSALPFAIPDAGAGPDGVIDRLEDWVRQARTDTNIQRVKDRLDGVTLALHGCAGQVVAAVAGTTHKN